ncbi:MAG: response regulator [SAR324 cluster bacterium]|nr:response regulator [SAR324 cluster bacterium]
MPASTILVVEDEEDILAVICYNLSKEGYRAEGVLSGEAALERIRQGCPDLIVLDLMLSGINGLEICQVLKKDLKTESIPIVMLTAKSEEADIIKGLELGADDYITKPFSPKILVARVKAVLRRQGNSNYEKERIFSVHELEIHPGRHEVLFKGRLIELTPTEFRLLHYLIQRPGWVFTRNQIVDAVRGDDYFVTDRAVDVQIVGLRKKLGDAGQYIETVRGIGYRFKE